MPRKPRLFLPGHPQHLVVRGHSREPVLLHEADFRYLYQCLRAAARHHSLEIHAWVFMHNHIHLLATPANAQSLPKTMQSTGRRYAQYFNRHYHRSGALWERRYKCCLVDTDNYLLSCYRYIELNPVRAGIVNRPGDYPYSSYRANALGKMDSMLTPHRVFLDFISANVPANNNTVGSTDQDPVVHRGNGNDRFATPPAAAENGKMTSGSTKIDSHGNTIAVTGSAGDRKLYRALCAEMLDRKLLEDIRLGTEKGSGIGQAKFLHKLALSTAN